MFTFELEWKLPNGNVQKAADDSCSDATDREKATDLIRGTSLERRKRQILSGTRRWRGANAHVVRGVGCVGHSVEGWCRSCETPAKRLDGDQVGSVGDALCMCMHSVQKKGGGFMVRERMCYRVGGLSSFGVQ